MHQVGYLQELNRDARSTKHRILDVWQCSFPKKHDYLRKADCHLFSYPFCEYRSRYSDWLLAALSVPILARATDFALPQNRPDRLGGLPSPLFSECWCSLLGVKRPVLEGNHASPSSAKVKNKCSYTSTPSISLYGVNRDKSTFYPFCDLL